MKTSKKGIELLKQFEGCKLTAYKCSGNAWTIGYGHTKGVKEGDTITQERADIMLAEDLIIYENDVNQQNLIITQNQFDALVCLVYNIGGPKFKASSLLKMLKVNTNSANIPTEWRRWNKAGGVVIYGLTRRRDAEIQLYTSQL